MKPRKVDAEILRFASRLIECEGYSITAAAHATGVERLAGGRALEVRQREHKALLMKRVREALAAVKNSKRTP